MKLLCKRLELISFTATPGMSFIANVTATTLTDGALYMLDIPESLAFPANLTGTEIFYISPANIPLPPGPVVVGDKRARVVFSERVKKHRRICMKYTAVSVASTINGTTITPMGCFIALDGIDPLPGLGQQ